MRHRRYDDETVLAERTARATRTRVALVYNYGADPEQPWETICCDHGGVCSHATRALAEAFLSHPDEWCEDCQHGEGTLAGKRDLATHHSQAKVEEIPICGCSNEDLERSGCRCGAGVC